MTDLQLCEPATPAAVEDHPEWIAERKLDGVRAVARDGRIETRSGNDVTERFPEIDPPDHHVIDGEIVTGDFVFETALRRVQTEDTFKVEMLAEKFPARLVAFDVLEVNGGDVRGEPLRERKELLGPSLPNGSGIVPITPHADPVALWGQATEEGWEGVVLKDPESHYVGKRSDSWLKIKDWEEDTFPILHCEETESGGFVAFVDIGTDDPQKVAVNGEEGRAKVENGADAAVVQYLERSDNNRLRKPSFRGVA